MESQGVVVCICEFPYVKDIVSGVCDELSIECLFVESLSEIGPVMEQRKPCCVLFMGEKNEDATLALRNLGMDVSCRIVIIENASAFIDSNHSFFRKLQFPFREKNERSRLDLIQIVGKHLPKQKKKGGVYDSDGTFGF